MVVKRGKMSVMKEVEQHAKARRSLALIMKAGKEFPDKYPEIFTDDFEFLTPDLEALDERLSKDISEKMTWG